MPAIRSAIVLMAFSAFTIVLVTSALALEDEQPDAETRSSEVLVFLEKGVVAADGGPVI